MSVRTALATSIKDTSCCCAAPDLRLLFIHHTRPRLILHPPLITSRRPRPRPRPRRRSRSRPSPAPVRSFFFFTLWGFGTLKLPGRRIPAALRPLSFALSLRHHPRLSLPSGRHRQRHNPNKNNTYHTTVPTVHHHPRHPPTHSHTVPTHAHTHAHTHSLSLSARPHSARIGIRHIWSLVPSLQLRRTDCRSGQQRTDQSLSSTCQQKHSNSRPFYALLRRRSLGLQQIIRQGSHAKEAPKQLAHSLIGPLLLHLHDFTALARWK